MHNPTNGPRHLADAQAAGQLAIFSNLATLRAAFALAPVALAALDEHRTEVAALFSGKDER